MGDGHLGFGTDRGEQVWLLPLPMSRHHPSPHPPVSRSGVFTGKSDGRGSAQEARETSPRPSLGTRKCVRVRLDSRRDERCIHTTGTAISITLRGPTPVACESCCCGQRLPAGNSVPSQCSSDRWTRVVIRCYRLILCGQVSVEENFQIAPLAAIVRRTLWSRGPAKLAPS